MPQIDLGQVVGPPGQDGADGQDGAPGAAAAITGASASAMTLSAGSAATAAVTADGTDASRSFVFSFGIPKGDKGDTGAAGPSNITTDTATNINGVLKGNGSKVSGVTVDSTPDAAHTGNLISSAAVADALAGKANASLIAPVEASLTASRAYAVNDVFIYNQTLYKATAAIASGGTIAPGTNCNAWDLGVWLTPAAYYERSINQNAGNTLTTLTFTRVAATASGGQIIAVWSRAKQGQCVVVGLWNANGFKPIINEGGFALSSVGTSTLALTVPSAAGNLAMFSIGFPVASVTFT